MMEYEKSEIEKLTICLTDTDNVINTFPLERQKQGERIIWKFEDEGFSIEIITDEAIRAVEKIAKSDTIVESIDEIRHHFLDAVFETKMNQLINIEDGFDDADEEEGEDGVKYNPYNPKLIRVDTKMFSIRQMDDLIERGDVDLSPDFQRGFVWNDITRKSRLIESLLLRIPIPVFYFAQDEEGMFQVVDGVQRLTVIHSFMKNEFRLKNLEYLSECNGKYFKLLDAKPDSLEDMYVRRIEQTQLFVNVIDPQTPGKVKYDIFKRINTGGKALNSQEIRNCLANARTRNFLHELSGSENFLHATRKSISAARMADDELVLRFIAFYLIDHKKVTAEYKGGMDELLNDTVERLNILELATLKEIRQHFFQAMDNAFYLFGPNAFRKANYVNKALFLGVSRVLCDIMPQQLREMDKDRIAGQMQIEINENEKFRNALSMATNDAKNVKLVYDTVKKIMGNKECIEN
ncbi:DUF262 domain-containing protein [Acetatifactor muris]|uniref:GmrSD restriction endonucleases N-terminal domain-containing protein n=1 Tax=Acetatifactor muris TaxID=879566 RepID=A0A2K4ZPL4_9FIRM|nr:DUF262 domain-containing protein [Acetatifactor muris]MCR2050878.1 DUF262 domain-containing protein [Acetatifactor muris]SOY32399.1 hypothetical protein AMURIS_05158 [Acetatifactor muris]